MRALNVDSSIAWAPQACTHPKRVWRGVYIGLRVSLELSHASHTRKVELFWYACNDPCLSLSIGAEDGEIVWSNHAENGDAATPHEQFLNSS